MESMKQLISIPVFHILPSSLETLLGQSQTSREIIQCTEKENVYVSVIPLPPHHHRGRGGGGGVSNVLFTAQTHIARTKWYDTISQNKLYSHS